MKTHSLKIGTRVRVRPEAWRFLTSKWRKGVGVVLDIDSFTILSEDEPDHWSGIAEVCPHEVIILRDQNSSLADAVRSGKVTADKFFNCRECGDELTQGDPENLCSACAKNREDHVK